MRLLPLLLIWIVTHVLHVGFGIAAIWRQGGDQPKRLGSLYFSFLGSISPWTTLLLFLVVFVIGGSSNVAQLAGDSGFELWSTCCGSWFLLLFGNLIAPM